MTATPGLNLIAHLSRTADNLRNLQRNFWICHRCWLDRDVQIVWMYSGGLVERVGWEGNATSISCHRRQEAYLQRTAWCVAHCFQKIAYEQQQKKRKEGDMMIPMLNKGFRRFAPNPE